MNADQIYQFQRDDAFAEQFMATEYRTFVAMPFSNRGGYPEKRIHTLFSTVHERLNEQLPISAPRRFAQLARVDELTGGSVVITDEIIRQVLSCHFFLGDLTGCNFGVVLECGLALALKPNARVLLVTQDRTYVGNFDVSVTRIVDYTEDDLAAALVLELKKAAGAYEAEADKYIRLISSQLSIDAILVLNIYGRLWASNPPPQNNPAIWEQPAAQLAPHRFRGTTGRLAYINAARELTEKRLLWNNFVPNAAEGRDTYGSHATNLGWRVIERLWQHNALMRRPPNAPTSPNG